MSRPKVMTAEARQLILEEAARRAAYRSNKQLAQILASKGVHVSPPYIGELVSAERRRIEREFSLRAQETRGHS